MAIDNVIAAQVIELDVSYAWDPHLVLFLRILFTGLSKFVESRNICVFALSIGVPIGCTYSRKHWKCIR